jgi:serine/threonine-protein kinase HipA
MSDLVVELYGTTVGSLTGSGQTFDFVADPAAVEEFGLDSLMLSVAVPLAAVPARSRRSRRQNFFRELLPEGRMLGRLAQQAGVQQRDVVGMLRAYGRDVAGALQIWDPEALGEPRTPALEPLSEDGVAEALDGYPSTHILKPASRDFPTIIYDEEYGSRLARALGLASFDTRFAGIPALVVERYDREIAADGAAPVRIHQEDFNQVLSLQSDQKYQRFGGKASLARMARELRMLGSHADLRRLARLTVLAAATGNLDMHAKNLALLHRRDGTIELAPAYDVVPQVHLPNDGELALAVDGTYRHAALTRSHLVTELGTWGLRDPEGLVDETLVIVLETLSGETPHPRAHPGLVDDLNRFVTNLRDGRAAGSGVSSARG